MTVDPNAPATEIPGAPLVTAEPDSRLEQLVAEFDRLDGEAKAAGERLDTVKKEIKAELAALKPGEAEILLTARGLKRPLRMHYRTSWRFDSKKLKATDPATWVRYAKETGAWYLERVK